MVGLSTSGPAQAEAIRAALGVRVDGKPLFRSVQATWNLLEPSAGPALAEAHDAGCLVIVKEALANGRLAVDGRAWTTRSRSRRHCSQPWATIVLSGAATADQLASNLRAERSRRSARCRSRVPAAATGGSGRNCPGLTAGVITSTSLAARASPQVGRRHRSR